MNCYEVEYTCSRPPQGRPRMDSCSPLDPPSMIQNPDPQRHRCALGGFIFYSRLLLISLNPHPSCQIPHAPSPLRSETLRFIPIKIRLLSQGRPKCCPRSMVSAEGEGGGGGARKGSGLRVSGGDCKKDPARELEKSGGGNA